MMGDSAGSFQYESRLFLYIYLKERNEEKGRKYFTTHIAGGSPQSANDEE